MGELLPGGSDDHHGGVNDSAPFTSSPVGNPTTMVLAANLSHAAVLEGVAAGRTVVKMYGPKDPMVVLQCTCDGDGGGVVDVGGWCVGGGTLTATVTTTDAGTVLTVLRNNGVEVTVRVPAASSAFEWSMGVVPPPGGVDRWRVELRDDGALTPRTLTNHIFVTQQGNGQHASRRR